MCSPVQSKGTIPASLPTQKAKACLKPLAEAEANLFFVVHNCTSYV